MEALLNPIVLGIVAVVLAGLIVFLVIQSRRRANEADVLPPELGDPVDYTSLPYEEPTTFRDRMRDAPPATKALLVLLPIVLLATCGVIYVTFFSQPPSDLATNAVPAPPAPEFTQVEAIVANPERIQVEARTTIQDGTTITATLQEGDQVFPWFDEPIAQAQVREGRISLQLNRIDDAPAPQQGEEYWVILGAVVDGQMVTSQRTQVTVPTINQRGFYQVADAPTATPRPAPTQRATPPPQPTATPQPAPAPTISVFNGGNIRREPNLGGEVLGQLNAGEVVALQEKNADGSWYRVDAPEADGWVSVTLLNEIPPDVAAQVPVQGAQLPPEATSGGGAPVEGLTAVVFNGGNVRAAPNLQGSVLDQINANETVQLIEKTNDSSWFKIVNEREVEGWVSVTLLDVAAQVAAQVPVTQ
jgi:flagellar FliL protein